MIKLSKKLNTIALVILFLGGFVFMRGYYKTYVSREVDTNVIYDIYGQDKYTYFGDGRFQIMNWATDPDKLQLIDFISYESEHFYVIREINKYILSNKMLYISGDFSYGTTDLKTGERVYYPADSVIPKLMILNIENGEAAYYSSIQEIPEEERNYFEMDLTGNPCLKDRTCYEQGTDTELSWWEVFYKIMSNSLE